MDSAPIDSYRDLKVWQRAMDISVRSYELTAEWPKSEQYGLTSQTRRAVTSIAANIAEGYGRDSKGSYAQFLRIAQGSLKEFETHLLLAVLLNFSPSASVDSVLAECNELGKMLRVPIRKIEAA